MPDRFPRFYLWGREKGTQIKAGESALATQDYITRLIAIANKMVLFSSVAIMQYVEMK